MKRIKVMWIAGEASGDVLAGELAIELRKSILEATAQLSPFSQPIFAPLEPYFFGAGGDKMHSSGINILIDFTKNSVIGPHDAIKNLGFYKEALEKLLGLAFCETPDLIICVDFSGFNLRFVSELKKRIKKYESEFYKFAPVLVQYISPQVWASRPWRAKAIARNFDLLLSIFPFEKEWYQKREPGFRVEFVGHPLLDRYDRKCSVNTSNTDKIRIVLLPGSRINELKHHIPLVVEAAKLIKNEIKNAEFSMVLPHEELKPLALKLAGNSLKIDIGIRNLAEELSRATLAIAATGTVTMECAFFRVPAIAIYKTSPVTYFLGKQLVTIRYLAMPNIIANDEIYPEFIQNALTPANVANAALKIINDKEKINNIKSRLDEVIKRLGEPGSAKRSAKIITDILIPALLLTWHK